MSLLLPHPLPPTEHLTGQVYARTAGQTDLEVWDERAAGLRLLLLPTPPLLVEGADLPHPQRHARSLAPGVTVARESEREHIYHPPMQRALLVVQNRHTLQQLYCYEAQVTRRTHRQADDDRGRDRSGDTNEALCLDRCETARRRAILLDLRHRVRLVAHTSRPLLAIVLLADRLRQSRAM